MADRAFHDHFSGHAADYARYRPTYPDELYRFLASVAPARGLAWDCATGNGQAARQLAEHFERVVATDASARQLAEAAPHPGIEFRVATAETSGLEAASVDLVTVAQALHWFDFGAFFAEVERVLRPGGVVAAWSYGLLRVSEPVDRLVRELYGPTVGTDWPPQRAHVMNAYADIPWPFPPLAADSRPPAFAMRARWSFGDLLGYLSTWSAVRRYRQRVGTDPVAELADDLAAAWGDPGETRVVVWDLALRIGRVGDG